MEVVARSTAGLGDHSYVVVNDGAAIVVDPQRDIERFLSVLDEHGAEATMVLETHLHNDYISGGLTLARHTGAQLVLPAGAGTAFEYVPAFHNELLSAGGLSIRPLHTPGHTPEHVSYVVELDGEPVAVFSGGSLLVGAAGRSDLLGLARARSLTPLQYRSVTRLGALPPNVELYPTHGAGSFCSASEAGASTSTIGEELATNPVLRYPDAATFVAGQMAGLQPFPPYYAHMGPANLDGPRPLPGAAVPVVDADGLAELIASGHPVVDARRKQAFAEAHIPGSWGIELSSDFVTWTGWLLPFDSELVLIVDEAEEIEEARVGLARIGFERMAAAMVGLGEWQAQGRPLVSHRTMTARQFLELDGSDLQVIDVRSPAEYDESRFPGSVHCYLPDLVNEAPAGLDPARPVYLGCTTGHRASVAAGVLADRGFEPVVLTGASLLGAIQLQAAAV